MTPLKCPGVGRDKDCISALQFYFSRPVTDDEMRFLHEVVQRAAVCMPATIAARIAKADFVEKSHPWDSSRSMSKPAHDNTRCEGAMKDLVDIMGGGRGRMPHDDDRSTKSDLHDFVVVLHYDTGKAVLVSDTGEEKRAVWIPKQFIEVHKDGKSGPAIKKDGQRTVLPIVTITVPQWLAKDKGLI